MAKAGQKATQTHPSGKVVLIVLVFLCLAILSTACSRKSYPLDRMENRNLIDADEFDSDSEPTTQVPTNTKVIPTATLPATTTKVPPPTRTITAQPTKAATTKAPTAVPPTATLRPTDPPATQNPATPTVLIPTQRSGPTIPVPEPTAELPGVNCNIDWDCGDFETRSYMEQVLTFCNYNMQADSWRLDRDKDGIACESLP